MANADEVMAELRRFQAAETARYSDLANKMQDLIVAERGRYQDYVRRFEAIMKALPGATLDPDPADPADPNTPTDPDTPADPESSPQSEA